MSLNNLPFIGDLSESFLEGLKNEHETVSFNKGEAITLQFEVGEYFYFLLNGGVQFSIKIDDEHEELTVSESDKMNTPVGWSGFRNPHRYATTVSCTENSSFIRWSHRALRNLIEKDPISGGVFLKFIVNQSQLMLQDTREILAQYSQNSKESFLDLNTFNEISKGVTQDGLDVLKRSPFFEVFTEEELVSFNAFSKETRFDRGEKIYVQEENASTFDVLIEGKVALIYESKGAENKLDKRTIHNEGYVVGSGCFTEDKKNHVSCVALAQSTIYRIDYLELEKYLMLNPDVGVQFYLRMLWFISSRLSSSRAKLITIKYEGEILAVKNLIEQNCTQLSVVSELHKVPHLLKHTYTLSVGIEKLNQIKREGTQLERSLAVSCLDILTEVVREQQFYDGLSSVYNEVVKAPNEWSHFQVRELCAKRFVEVFENTNFVLKGEENIPDTPSVFIYNHLKNHDFNTLPNNFQLTLDSHFVSSIILYKKYKDPGIRVVRVPKGDEYGHQYYYERLGHIPVYTKDSAMLEETEEEKKRRRDLFYETASDYLENGTSIMLAPEGQSLSTSASPAEFKSGAFRLPTLMKKEPYIVPIAMANFDKRLNHTTFAAVVKKPFKISDRLEDPTNREEMSSFLASYQKEFRSYVEEAIDLSQRMH